jgi:hypothetical protein
MFGRARRPGIPACRGNRVAAPARPLADRRNPGGLPLTVHSDDSQRRGRVIFHPRTPPRHVPTADDPLRVAEACDAPGRLCRPHPDQRVEPGFSRSCSFGQVFGSLQRFRLTPFVSISILMRRVTLRPKGRGASLDRARTIRTAKRS